MTIGKAGLVLIGTGCLLLAVAVTVWQIASVLNRPYRGYSGPETFLVIPRGEPISRISESLQQGGIISSSWLFRCYVRLRPAPFEPRAGEYRFSQPLSLVEVARKLHRGEVYYHKISIPEGLTMLQTAARFAGRGFGRMERYREILENPALIADLDPEAGNLEGYLFPETYLLTRDMDELQIIRAMTDGFRRIWTPCRVQRARQLGLSVRQVVTLASLIEKEAAAESERPLVSAVFHNRLQKGMNLASDPTVIYAVSLVKEYDGVINQSDLELDSAYNTYLYPGLPPGPIANAGQASIEAALYPADVDYMFFVSKNDGTHQFSSNYRDHQRAVLTHQRH